MKLADRLFCGALLIGSMCATPALAQHVPVPLMTAEEVAGMLDRDELESRVDGDLNGDGELDTVFVARGEERRYARVMLAYRSEVDFGHEPVAELELDASPLGAAALSIRKGVLVIEDLTGGTTATATTYRYRYDRPQHRMRLIGIDAERYSRTNRHDIIKVSWNLLNGDHVVERGTVHAGPGDEAYDYAQPDRTKQRSPPVYMEETPNPDALIDSHVIPEGEDRD